MAKDCGCSGCGKKDAVMYNTTTQEYTGLKSVVVEKLCNGVTVINKGTTIVTWNGLPLNPGESMTVGGNKGEVFVGRVDLKFVVQSPAPTVITDSAWVLQKFYVGENFV